MFCNVVQLLEKTLGTALGKNFPDKSCRFSPACNIFIFLDTFYLKVLVKSFQKLLFFFLALTKKKAKHFLMRVMKTAVIGS